MLGDQLAKVGVSVLVFQRTHSTVLTALTFALTLLPDLVGGPLLSPLADRFPRRAVMVVCTLVQAILAATMAVPGLPLAAVTVAVALITAGQAPYKAAQTIVVRDVLDANLRKTGQVRLNMIRETGQLIGLAGAGAIVGLIGPQVAIVLDAISFAVAGLLVHFGVPLLPRPIRSPRTNAGRGPSALRAIRADRRLVTLTWLVLLCSATILPDAVMVPLVSEVRAPTWTVGLLLAADCLGFLLGAALVSRYCTARRQRELIGPLAVLAVVAMVPFVMHPSVVMIGVLLAVSGAGASYLPLVGSEVVELAPDGVAGAVSGWIRAGLNVGQGTGALLGGVLAQWIGSPALAIAAVGAVTTVPMVVAAVRARAYTQNVPTTMRSSLTGNTSCRNSAHNDYQRSRSPYMAQPPC